jgi:hypothetical protein
MPNGVRPQLSGDCGYVRAFIAPREQRLQPPAHSGKLSFLAGELPMPPQLRRRGSVF